ncbi:hypothetical protein Bca52824_015691 [Brassica carinata]|uniref:TIR domain-containing protein n=1 Tax=Brassica carinata TaxID=52824 RepID=A0A8X8B5M4_BRACI|nr:hypothetical protein Bca52824_015691 [Brassica carinata]
MKIKKIPRFKTKVVSLQPLESKLSFSSSSLTKNYDVFLSFRGPDTRKKFVSFLHKELEAKGILTFQDDKELVRGRPISTELVEAIKGSRIAVVVISPTYAASTWCLKELVKIMELEEKGLLTVVPIFYEVDPCQLRRRTGEVAEQFEKHKTRYRIERVKLWIEALTRVTILSGECSKNWENEARLVDGITKKISEILSKASQSNGAQVTGIWGRGSNGISTLARRVYEDISPKFEAHCFLEDVRRIPLGYRNSHLQEALLSSMRGEGLMSTIQCSSVCYDMIKARLGNKKVLLVANEVDNIGKLEALADEFVWFGPGSRIIVTTQDKQLFSSAGVKRVYEAEFLRCYKAGKLWRSEAFIRRDNHVDSERSTYRRMNLPGINLLSTPKYLMNLLSDGDQLIERFNAKIYGL